MRLHEYLSAHGAQAFQWGVNDCVTFAAKWIEINTNVDALKDLPKWASKEEALLVIDSVGGLEKAIDDRLARIHPNLAKDGDIAMYDRCVCIFSGSKLVAPGENGLIYVDRKKAKCAWKF